MISEDQRVIRLEVCAVPFCRADIWHGLSRQQCGCVVRRLQNNIKSILQLIVFFEFDPVWQVWPGRDAMLCAGAVALEKGLSLLVVVIGLVMRLDARWLSDGSSGKALTYH